MALLTAAKSWLPDFFKRQRGRLAKKVSLCRLVSCFAARHNARMSNQPDTQTKRERLRSRPNDCGELHRGCLEHVRFCNQPSGRFDRADEPGDIDRASRDKQHVQTHGIASQRLGLHRSGQHEPQHDKLGFRCHEYCAVHNYGHSVHEQCAAILSRDLQTMIV
jgi:hypothetical protein